MIITGEYIRTLRKEKKLTQEELAKLTGVSQAHIAKIENNKVDPRLSTINKILAVLSKSRKKACICREIMTKNVIFAKPNTPVREIIKIMRMHGISQIPVIDNGIQIGSIRETTLLQNMERNLEGLQAKDILDRPFPVVDEDDMIDMVSSLLDMHPAVLVAHSGKINGIITKSDLLSKKY